MGCVEITHLLLKLLPGGEMYLSDHISFATESHVATANFKGSGEKQPQHEPGKPRIGEI